MGCTYHLFCFECLCYLSFGKLYWVDEAGNSLDTTTFDGIYDAEQRKWRKRDAYFGRAIEAFLIQHRNHEIRFVPEGVDELLEKHVEEIVSLEAEDLFQTHGIVGVDSEAELASWSSRLKNTPRPGS